jgi:hypothetical protein
MAAKRAFLIWTTFLSILGTVSAHAQPITGTTYTYDLSTEDVDPGGFPVLVRPYMDAGDTANDTMDASNQSAITSRGKLTDGQLGSTLLSDPNSGCCLFNNGTYAGFRGDPGIGLAPKPKINVNLGGEYALDSFTLHYLVEDQPSIYSPRRVPDNNDPIMFDAVTVFGSTNGVDFTKLGFSNDTNPVFGLDGDFGSGAREVRSLSIPLNGGHATHLMIDVRSPWTYIFLGEFVVTGSAVGGLPGDYNGNGAVDGADYVLWRNGGPLQNEIVTPGTVDQADYNEWRARFGNAAGTGAAGLTSVPEPNTICLFGLGCLWPLVFRWRS